MQEWIIGDDASLTAFSRGEAPASFTPDGRWAVEAAEAEGGAVARLEHHAGGWRMTKQIELPAHGERLTVSYDLRNDGPEPRSGRVLSEWNLSAPQAADGDDRIARIECDGRRGELHRESGELHSVTAFVIRGSAAYGLRAELRGAELQSNAGGRHVARARVNDIELHYEIHGEGEPLLWIGGLGANLFEIPYLIESYTRHFRFIVFESRGCGRSDKPDGEYSMAGFADDTAALLDAIGVESAVV